MKNLPLVLVLVGLVIGCSPKESPVTYNLDAASNRIVSALPHEWTVTLAPPEQHFYATNFFANTVTREFMLLGPRPNYFEWTDHSGNTHRTNHAKECLYIWIVPGRAVAKSMGPFWNLKSPTTVFSAPNLGVYAQVSQQIILSPEQMKKILDDSQRGCCPEVYPSWANWRRDIAGVLRKEP
ncbi:MAG: hypothetical protein ACLP2Y_15265 [Limisphaerales bacterium]